MYLGWMLVQMEIKIEFIAYKDIYPYTDELSIVYLSNGIGGSLHIIHLQSLIAGSGWISWKLDKSFEPAGGLNGHDVLAYSAQRAHNNIQRSDLYYIEFDDSGNAMAPQPLIPPTDANSEVKPSWSPNGSTLTYFDDNGVWLYDLASGKSKILFRGAARGRFRRPPSP